MLRPPAQVHTYLHWAYWLGPALIATTVFTNEMCRKLLAPNLRSTQQVLLRAIVCTLVGCIFAGIVVVGKIAYKVAIVWPQLWLPSHDNPLVAPDQKALIEHWRTPLGKLFQSCAVYQPKGGYCSFATITTALRTYPGTSHDCSHRSRSTKATCWGVAIRGMSFATRNILLLILIGKVPIIIVRHPYTIMESHVSKV